MDFSQGGIEMHSLNSYIGYTSMVAATWSWRYIQSSNSHISILKKMIIFASDISADVSAACRMV